MGSRLTPRRFAVQLRGLVPAGAGPLPAKGSVRGPTSSRDFGRLARAGQARALKQPLDASHALLQPADPALQRRDPPGRLPDIAAQPAADGEDQPAEPDRQGHANA